VKRLVILFFVLLFVCVGQVHAFTFMGGKLASNHYEIVSFTPNVQNKSIDVIARACPSFIFGSMIGGTELRPKLMQKVAGRVNQWKRANSDYNVARISFDASLETSAMRNASSGNRCTAATIMYQIIPKKPITVIKAKTAVAESNSSVLKVGLRNGFPMISMKNGSSWDGAAVIFAEAVGRKLGREVRFVEISTFPKCLSSTKYGMVDMSISLISYRPERAKKYILSKDYFRTGIVAATLNPSTLSTVKKAGFNSARYTAVVAAGTTAETLVKKSFSKMKVVSVRSTPDVYEKAKVLELNSKENPDGGIIMITDEVIAMSWPGVFIIEGNKRLFSTDKYVVVAKNATIQTAINAVIDTDNISEMYQELVGR